MRNDSLAVEFVILSVAVTTVSNHFKYYQRTVQCFKNTETRKASLIRLAPALTEASLTFPAPLSLCSVLLNQGDAVVRVIYVRKTKQIYISICSTTGFKMWPASSSAGIPSERGKVQEKMAEDVRMSYGLKPRCKSGFKPQTSYLPYT